MTDAPVPAVPASSLILLRDRADLQVLVGRRPKVSRAFPGATVFPGGKVDAQDADVNWPLMATGCDGLEPDQRALRIAVIRETFEESGLLLAVDRRGAPAMPAAAALAAGREAVASGEAKLIDVLEHWGLILDVAALTPFARWVTPVTQPRRFDTWFYVAVTALDAPHIANTELEDLRWVSPQALLEAATAGEETVLFPTRANLGLLTASGTAADAVAAARARRIAPVCPGVAVRGERRVITIPIDAGYGVIEYPLEAAR